jgi:DNA-binding MarR family transcriptional regulator
MLDKSSDASRIVDKLVAKKLVTRVSCPSDRRSVNLLISEKGLGMLKELDYIDDATRKIFKNLPEKDIQHLNVLLDQLRG